MIPLVERILGGASGKESRAGTRIEANLDAVVLTGARVPSTLLALKDAGGPWAPDRLLLTMDFQAPEVESRIPRSRALCRELSEEFGVSQVFDLNMGIGTQVALESGHIRPGMLAAGCGRCLGVAGGVGALALDLPEEDLVRAMATGKLSLDVPPSIQVQVEGRLPRHVGAWDVAAHVMDLLGDGLPGRAVEMVGEVKDWGVDLRIALTGLLREKGAFASLVEPDAAVARFYKDHGVSVDVEEVRGETGYERVVTLDATRVEARSAPDYGGAGRPLPAEDGEAIQGIFIGSCYGGRYADLALVAEVLKRQGRVTPGVRLVISPATLETARACLAAGFYETFLQVGAMVSVPGGGPGSAAGAIFGDGELIASTAEYHRHLQPGQGLPTVHIVSPATAAVAAATGRLEDPAEFLA